MTQNGYLTATPWLLRDNRTAAAALLHKTEGSASERERATPQKHAYACVRERTAPASFIAPQERDATRTPPVSICARVSRLFTCTKDPLRMQAQIYQAAQDLNFNHGLN
jgi:hypothetical protein